MERWPQYKGHIKMDAQGKPAIHLNVLTYFLFWTAFYVLRGSHSSASSAATRPVRTLSLTPNFGSVKKVGPAHSNLKPILYLQMYSQCTGLTQDLQEAVDSAHLHAAAAVRLTVGLVSWYESDIRT